MPDNIYDLIMSADEPSAAQKAANMAALLRREQTAGQLMQLHPLLRQMGSSILQTSGQGMNQLAGAGDTRFAGRQRQQMQESQQAFTAGESQKTRNFEGRQGALNRALQRELAQAKAAAKGNLDFNDKDQLRKEFNGLPEVQAYKKVGAAVGKIEKAAANPSPAGDVSLIYGYMTALDPGSSVKEGEIATAQNAAGTPTQIRNLYNHAISGERLTPEQRADFVAQAHNLISVHKGQYDTARNRYSSIAQRYAVDPLEIIGEEAAVAPAASPTQAPTASGPTPTGRTKRDSSGALWEELSDGTARKVEG